MMSGIVWRNSSMRLRIACQTFQCFSSLPRRPISLLLVAPNHEQRTMGGVAIFVPRAVVSRGPYLQRPHARLCCTFYIAGAGCSDPMTVNSPAFCSIPSGSRVLNEPIFTLSKNCSQSRVLRGGREEVQMSLQ